jgi:CRISPR-associated exonuclease Cas4
MPATVRLVAVAKALSWERERPVTVVHAEFPAHGVVRRIPLTRRRKARYRRIVRQVEAMDGLSPRVENDHKCAQCTDREECGTRTRLLWSLLGL